jgi:hypothetical protein
MLGGVKQDFEKQTFDLMKQKTPGVQWTQWGTLRRRGRVGKVPAQLPAFVTRRDILPGESEDEEDDVPDDEDDDEEGEQAAGGR